MLQRVLALIRSGEAGTTLEIASRLGVSPTLVLQMAEELTRKGYLAEASPGCQEDQSGCSDCSSTGACHLQSRHWALTQKGHLLGNLGGE
jgi:hypothetical protein